MFWIPEQPLVTRVKLHREVQKRSRKEEGGENRFVIGGNIEVEKAFQAWQQTAATAHVIYYIPAVRVYSV